MNGHKQTLCAPQDSIPYGKPVLVAEVCRPSPASSSQDVAKLAADYVAWGADAIAVATDLEDTPAGLSDLFAVCRAVKVPVLQWDWFLHPLQVSHASLIQVHYASTCSKPCVYAAAIVTYIIHCSMLHHDLAPQVAHHSSSSHISP